MSKEQRHTPYTPLIKWLDWGRTAFERAKAEDKLILLYLTTPWGNPVHLFERGALKDDRVVELLKDSYIPIRVDAFKVPDVAERYNQGAWPALCVLSPTGELLHGRTHLTTDFTRQILEQVSKYYEENHAEITEQIEKADPPSFPRLRPGLDFTSAAATLDAIRHDALGWFDVRYHGFGRAPKFSNSDLLNFLLEDHDENVRRMSYLTLETMRKSPLRDPLRGGFHRYCEDEAWRIPQQDKVLSDNLGLLDAYLEAARQTDDELMLNAAKGIVSDIEASFGDESGLLYAAVDSDSVPGERASYYGWSEEEVRKALENDDDVEILLVHFGFQGAVPIPGSSDKFFLEQRVPANQIAIRPGKTLEEVNAAIERGIQALRSARSERTEPGVEATFYTRMQGRALGSLATASIHFENPRFMQRAFEIADILWKVGRSEFGCMLHEVNANDEDTLFLADQVEVIHGYLELYRISGRASDLVRAVTLTEETLEFFGDDQGPGCFDHIPRENEYGVLRYPYTPFEENSRLLHAVTIIAAITQESKWHDRAQQMIGALEEYRFSFRLRDANYGRALRRFVETPAMVDLLTGEGIGSMRVALIKDAPAGTLIRAFDPDQKTPWTLMEKYPTNGGKARAAVIAGGQVYEPTHDVDLALHHLIEKE